MKIRWLAVVCILHVLLWLLLKPPVPHSDDRVYVEEGLRMMSAEYSISESPKSHRLLVIVPVAVFVKLFGHSPFVVSLWPLLCSLLTIAGVFLLLRQNVLIAFTASFFVSCNMVQLIYSSVAFPDAVVSLFFFMAVSLLLLRHQIPAWAGATTAFIILAGFFAKQIMLLVIPYFIFCSWEDVKMEKGRLYWKSFYAASAVFFLAVLMISKGLTGQWFFLLQSVEEHHNDVFVQLTSQQLFCRLTAEPLVFLFSQAGYWPLMMLAFPAFFLKGENVDFWKKYTVILLLLLWFGTTSVHRWAPLPLLDRMWMVMIVPASILTAYGMNAWLQKGLSSLIKTGVYCLFLASAGMALCFFSPLRAGMLLMFPMALFIAEKGVRKKYGTKAAMSIILLPYMVLALWFVLQNTNW